MASNTEILNLCRETIRNDGYIQWWWMPAYYIEFVIFYLVAILPEKIK